jgi:hypothetical protein
MTPTSIARSMVLVINQYVPVPFPEFRVALKTPAQGGDQK